MLGTSRKNRMRGGAPSWTALEVARKLVGLRYDPELAPLLPHKAAETTERLLVALNLLPSWLLSLARQPTIRRLGYRIENVLGAHSVHFGLRKRFVDDEVRCALAGNTAQVLVIGAGYDTLAMRLAAEYPDRLFVEVDHPATHVVKQAGVDALGAGRQNLRLHGVDLGIVGLDVALKEVSAWQMTAPSAVVVEGVLMYLQPKEVGTLLSAVHASTGPGSRLVFTWARGTDGKPDIGSFGPIAARVMTWVGEPWRFFLPHENALQDLMVRMGFEYRPDPPRFDPRLRYVEPSEVDHRGWSWAPEFLAVAEWRG